LIRVRARGADAFATYGTPPGTTALGNTLAVGAGLAAAGAVVVGGIYLYGKHRSRLPAHPRRPVPRRRRRPLEPEVLPPPAPPPPPPRRPRIIEAEVIPPRGIGAPPPPPGREAPPPPGREAPPSGAQERAEAAARAHRVAERERTARAAAEERARRRAVPPEPVRPLPESEPPPRLPRRAQPHYTPSVRRARELGLTRTQGRQVGLSPEASRRLRSTPLPQPPAAEPVLLYPARLRYVMPSPAAVALVGEAPDPGLFMRRIEDALRRERGVRYRVEDTISLGVDTEQGEIVGYTQAMYRPEHNDIVQTPAMTYPQPESLRVNVHEGVHALLHNRGCFPSVHGVLNETVAEAEAEIATVAVLADLGQSLEVFPHWSVPAGSYTIDWNKVREELGPEAEARVKWATNWLLSAAQGDEPSGQCPPPPAKLRAPKDFQVFETTLEEYVRR
jgi:hypothetical protein